MIGRGRHIQIKLKEKCPIQIDGEPWMQKAATLDILYRGQVPMLTQPTSKVEEAVGVMMESLEWAKAMKVINEEQYQQILSKYQEELRSRK